MYFDMVCIELVSADIAGRLAYINGRNISLYRISYQDYLTATFTIRKKDFPFVHNYLKEHGDKVRVVSTVGPGIALLWIQRRFLLSAGLTAILFLTLWLPKRVLFIEVEGNSGIPVHQILQSAQDSGLFFGASVRDIRSERIKNTLLAQIPQLQWVGVNTRGCVATICVSERDAISQKGKGQDISSLVASRDAVVTELTVTRGNALCKVGSVVRKGEVLVSGYTDCGLKIQATNAEGEIFGQTIYDCELIFPAQYVKKGRLVKETVKYFLVVGKKEIKFSKDSGISGMICDKMYASKVLTLPGGFQLPVGLRIEICRYLEPEPVTFMLDQVFSQMQASAQSYLKAGMISGTVLSKEETTEERGECFCLKGRYLCREMIARIHNEEIGAYYGQNGRKDRERG